MLRKNVKSLLEQFQFCIFAEIVFGVRCTLILNPLAPHVAVLIVEDRGGGQDSQ